MAGNVVNLNRFRKKKQREERAKQAEINRVRHGRTKAQKEREIADRERAARILEGKRLERGDEESGAAGRVVCARAPRSATPHTGSGRLQRRAVADRAVPADECGKREVSGRLLHGQLPDVLEFPEIGRCRQRDVLSVSG